METRKIDQGTVVYGIRSKKYPTVACYGIIITARCDIAQKKVPKYYYLVAVDAVSWLKSEHGFEQAYRSCIAQKLKGVVEKAKAVELDGNTLVKLSNENVEIITNDYLASHPNDKKHKKLIESLRSAIQDYHVFCCDNMDDQKRAFAIQHRNKDAINCLKDIEKGKLHHYYYLPQDAYLNNGVKNQGLIVDLLEIDSIPVEDAKRLTEPYEKCITLENTPKLPETKELEQLAKNENQFAFEAVLRRVAEHFRIVSAYWLEDDSCFVDIEGTTKSPWLEHLMQKFSNAFVRIGIDNPTDDDIKHIVGQIIREDT